MGARVRVVGLVARPEFNEQLAEVVGVPKAGRVPVLVRSSRHEALLLKPKNLSLLSDIDDHDQSSSIGLDLPRSPMWTPPSSSTELLAARQGASATLLDTVLLDNAARRVVGGVENGWRFSQASDTNAASCFQPSAASDWRVSGQREKSVQPSRASSRWCSQLEGGHVIEADARTPDGRHAIAGSMRRRLPIVIRHAAQALAPAVHAELSSVEQVGLHFEGVESVHVLRAREQASQAKFMRFAPEGSTHYAPVLLNQRLQLPWEELAQQWEKNTRAHAQRDPDHDPGGSCDYMQFDLAARFL